jgi:hypothetical protein
MATTNYFELYESLRKKYKPGTVWVTKNANSIEKLKIVDKSRYAESLYSTMASYSGRMIYFEILETNGFYRNGDVISWPESYMEENYEIES